MTYKEAWEMLMIWLEERVDRYMNFDRICINVGLDDLAALDEPMAEALRDVIATMNRISVKIEEEDYE